MVDLGTKTATAVITEIFKQTLTGIRHSAGRYATSLSALDPFGLIASKYSQSIIQRYGSMKIFGMSEPMPLEEIYTNVNVLKEVSAHRYISPEEMQMRHHDELMAEISGYGQRQFGPISETSDGLSVFNKLDKFILLGKPGSGKTTFLHHILLRGVFGKLEKHQIPVFLPLHAIATTSSPLVEYAQKEFSKAGIENAESFVRAALTNGNLIFLMDGLDEVPDSNKESITQQIIEVSDTYPGNKFVVSCRNAAYNSWFRNFYEVEIADFSVEQTKNFIKNWFRGDENKSKYCISSFFKNKSLSELGKTPLFLAMVCLSFENNLQISSNRAELYSNSMDAILNRWDSIRFIRRDGAYAALTHKRKEELFSHLASRTFPSALFFMRKERWAKLIEEYIVNLPFDDARDAIPSGLDILRQIASHHGILVERAKDVYSFSHLTFQEYFIARKMIMSGPESIGLMIGNHITSPRWREVFVLSAAMVDAADYFIYNIMKEMANYGYSGKYIDKLGSMLNSIKADRVTTIFGENMNLSLEKEGNNNANLDRKHVIANRNSALDRLKTVRSAYMQKIFSIFVAAVRDLANTSDRHIYNRFVVCKPASQLEPDLAQKYQLNWSEKSKGLPSVIKSVTPDNRNGMRSKGRRLLNEKEFKGYFFTKVEDKVFARMESFAYSMAKSIVNYFKIEGEAVVSESVDYAAEYLVREGLKKLKDAENDRSTAIYLAELLIDILDQPIYIRFDTRALALDMIANYEPDRVDAADVRIQRSQMNAIRKFQN